MSFRRNGVNPFVEIDGVMPVVSYMTCTTSSMSGLMSGSPPVMAIEIRFLKIFDENIFLISSTDNSFLDLFFSFQSKYLLLVHNTQGRQVDNRVFLFLLFPEIFYSMIQFFGYGERVFTFT